MAVVKIFSLIVFIFLMVKFEGRHTSLISHSVKYIYIYIKFCINSFSNSGV